MQSWRTTKFTRQDPDLQIEVLLEPVVGGTRLTLHHSNVPDGHAGYQDGGWQEHYFEPMKRYFGSPADVTLSVATLHPLLQPASATSASIRANSASSSRIE